MHACNPPKVKCENHKSIDTGVPKLTKFNEISSRKYNYLQLKTTYESEDYAQIINDHLLPMLENQQMVDRKMERSEMF